jgi:hypothetical protein
MTQNTSNTAIRLLYVSNYVKADKPINLFKFGMVVQLCNGQTEKRMSFKKNFSRIKLELKNISKHS